MDNSEGHGRASSTGKLAREGSLQRSQWKENALESGLLKYMARCNMLDRDADEQNEGTRVLRVQKPFFMQELMCFQKARI